MSKDRIISIIVLVICLFLIVSQCNREASIEYIEKIDTLTVIKTDTIIETITEFKWKEVIVYREIPQDIDTNLILKDYFSIRYYEREVERDYLKLMIKDSITQNQIHWSEMEYQVYKDTVFINITKEKTHLKYKSGFYGDLMISPISISPGISYMNRRGYQMGISLGIIQTDEVRLVPHLRFSVPLYEIR